MAVGSKRTTQLIDAAKSLLCREGLLGVGRVLSPEALSRATRRGGREGVSKDTAGRLWPHRYDAIVDVARAVTDAESSGVSEAIAAALASFSPADPTDSSYGAQKHTFRQVLVRNFEEQFTTIGMPTGWLLQAAALTSSPLWKGAGPDAGTQLVGRQVLAARADLYEFITRSWANAVRNAMSQYGRRPRHPFTVEMIIQLMHALFDGCMLRFFIDPGLNDPAIDDDERQRRLDWVIAFGADAMFELAWSYTEPGSQDDPRLPPGDSVASRFFDAVVDLAMDLYAAPARAIVVDPSGPGFADDAQRTGLGLDAVVAAKALFPDPGDLADTVLRRLVVAAGNLQLAEPTEPHTENVLALVESLLGRLMSAAVSHPGLILAAQSHPPTHPRGATSIIDELTDAIAGALNRSPLVSCRDPAGTAVTLVDLALAGDEHGWKGIEAVLHQMKPPDPG